jgi:DNA polymerase III subunit epsilon
VSAARPAPPPRRARRLPWRQLELVALDFEATGLDFAKDAIVSFGVVPIRMGRIDVGDAVYQLIDPEDVVPSPESVTVHGLRPIDLRGAQSPDVARAALGALIAGRFLVTWAGQVEAGFLDAMYGGGVRSWLRRCIDTRELMLSVEENPPAPFTLASVAERLGVPVANPHHALDDALVTAQVFLIAAARLEAKGVSILRALQAIKQLEPPTLRRPRAPIRR